MEEPDVVISKTEMRRGLKDVPTSCMTISSDVLEPTRCCSKAGAGTASMFGHHGKAGHGGAKPQGLSDYAALFDKFYGSDSVMERLVSAHKGNRETRGGSRKSPSKARTASASPAASDRSHAIRSTAVPTAAEVDRALKAEDLKLDREIAQRAGRETRAKYLTPFLAAKYNVEVEGIPREPPLNPSLHGLRMVPTGALPKDMAIGLGDKQGAAKVMELARTLEEAERQRAARAGAVRQRNAKVQAIRSVKPRPSSSSFKTTTRAQAQMTSVRDGGVGSAGSLGPGMYDSGRYHAYIQRHVASPYLSKPPEADKARRSGGIGSGSGANGEGYDDDNLESALSDGDIRERKAGEAPLRGNSAAGDKAASSQTKSQATTAATSGTTAKAHGLAMFKDAHRVHQRPGTAPAARGGSSAFKTRPRQTIDASSTASHLFLQYYKEGFDSILQKSPKLITSFQLQVPHPPMGTAADTPETIGPGSYINNGFMPDRMSGAHVAAGHDSHLRYTLDFSRQVTRPGSAPPASVINNRPFSAATKGGKPSPTAGEAAAVLKAMFNSTTSPSEMYVGVAALQARAYQESYQRTGIAPRRPPPSARRVGGGGMAAGVGWADDGDGGIIEEADEEEWFGQQDEAGSGVGPEVSYLGPEELLRFSSAGLAKRVPGGRMSLTTRETETMGLRAMSKDGVIPPASGPLRMGAGADVVYEPDDRVQAHRPRSPSWQLPPNRNARSKAWISSAALAYL